jgi:hypothetical protein
MARVRDAEGHEGSHSEVRGDERLCRGAWGGRCRQCARRSIAWHPIVPTKILTTDGSPMWGAVAMGAAVVTIHRSLPPVLRPPDTEQRTSRRDLRGKVSFPDTKLTQAESSGSGVPRSRPQIARPPARCGLRGESQSAWPSQVYSRALVARAIVCTTVPAALWIETDCAAGPLYLKKLLATGTLL